jgi:hypothetical protein
MTRTLANRLAKLGREIGEVASAGGDLTVPIISDLFAKYDEIGTILTKLEWDDGGPDE